MNDNLLGAVTKFTKFSVFAQVTCIAITWLFLVLTVDAWFSPFFLSGYQLIFYMFVVIVLSAWTTHIYVHKLIQSPTPISWPTQKNQGISSASCKLSLKDVCDKELKNLAELATSTVVDYWADDSDDNQEFVLEIQNHVEDIFLSVKQKLSKINVESFVKNFILIMHNHVKTYTEARNAKHSTRNVKAPFLHPVSRGEISIEVYLDSLLQTVMKEFIPGAIQDCSAIFDLSCAALCSQILMKFIESFSQPEVILQALVQIFESDCFSASTSEKNMVMPTEHKLEHHYENNFSEISSTTELEDNQEASLTIANNQPLMEGPPISSFGCASYFINASQLDESSYVQTGLSRTLSAATAPLLPSQLTADANQSQTQSIQKPNSLPLLTPEEKPATSDPTSPPAPHSLEGDSSPVYEVLN